MQFPDDTPVKHRWSFCICHSELLIQDDWCLIINRIQTGPLGNYINYITVTSFSRKHFMELSPTLLLTVTAGRRLSCPCRLGWISIIRARAPSSPPAPSTTVKGCYVSSRVLIRPLKEATAGVDGFLTAMERTPFIRALLLDSEAEICREYHSNATVFAYISTPSTLRCIEWPN